MAGKGEIIPAAWLMEPPMTAEELERMHTRTEPEADVRDPELRARRFERLRRPFGFAHENWVAMRAKMQPGDELRLFDSGPESWRRLCGRSGVALVRGGVAIDAIWLAMN